jgi:hypothetical protein
MIEFWNAKTLSTHKERQRLSVRILVRGLSDGMVELALEQRRFYQSFTSIPPCPHSKPYRQSE